MLRRLLHALLLICALPALAWAVGQPLPALDATSSGKPGWLLPYNPGVDFNFAKGLYWQGGHLTNPTSALTVSRASTAYEDDLSGNWTSFGNNVLRVTNKGALIEEARTNSIRNNSMQGAVAGTPGTLPTNWVLNSDNGLTRQIVGTGIANGIDYIDVRWSGTTTGTAIIWLTEGTQVIAASQGQTWTNSIFMGLQAGSLTNVTAAKLLTAERSASGSNLLSNASPDFSGSITSSLARMPAYTVTLSQATTAFVAPFFQFNTSSSAAVDFTIRIGWPQLELGAFSTSPIRTTNAAVTRAADAVTLTTVPSNLTTSSTIYAAGTTNVPNSDGNSRAIVSIDDGSLTNRLSLRVQTGAAGPFNTTGGSNFGPGFLGSNVSGVALKMAQAAAPSDQAFYLNQAGTITSSTNASGTPIASPTITQIHIGTNALSQDTARWDGYITRIAMWPTTRLPNAALQAITAP